MSIPKIFSEEYVKLPVGGEFAPTGFVGPWQASILYAFLTQGSGAEGADLTRVLGESGWVRNYFHDPEAANTAYVGEFNPQQVWYWQVEAAKVLNFFDPEIVTRFGSHIGAELRVVTLRSKRYRHELQFMALPSAVAAMANAAGYDNPGFDLSDLTGQDIVFSDELFADLCGDPESGDYSKAKFPLQRKALWAALGEDDLRMYQPIDTGERFSTKAPKLSECLQILVSRWIAPMWCRVVLVPDPRPDAVYESKTSGETKRLTIPCVTEIFGSEKEAREIVAKEREERGQTEGTPPLPDAWAEISTDWAECVLSIKQVAKGSAAIPIVAKAIKELYGSDLGASAAEVVAWFPYVGKAPKPTVKKPLIALQYPVTSPPTEEEEIPF